MATTQQQFEKRLNIFTLTAIALSAIAIFITGTEQAFELSRTDLRGGQLWRFLTGHFTHWDFNHFAWDLITFLGLGWVCVKLKIKAITPCLILSAITISFGSLAINESIEIYRGLSGLDTSLFMLAVVTCGQLAYQKGQLHWVILMAVMVISLLLKCLYEQYTGLTLFADSTQSGYIPVVSAHLIGGFIGAIVGLSTSPTPSPNKYTLKPAN